MSAQVKHFSHDVMNYNHDTHKLDYVRTDDYYFDDCGTTLLVIQRNNDKKVIRVKPDDEFVYSVKKTQVNAKGGARGLAEFLADPEWKSTAVRLLDAMMDSVKPATLHPWE